MKNVLDFFRSFFSGCRVNKLRYIAPGTPLIRKTH